MEKSRERGGAGEEGTEAVGKGAGAGDEKVRESRDGSGEGRASGEEKFARGLSPNLPSLTLRRPQAQCTTHLSVENLPWRARVRACAPDMRERDRRTEERVGEEGRRVCARKPARVSQRGCRGRV